MRGLCALVVLACLAAAAASRRRGAPAARPAASGDAWALPEAGSCSPKGGRALARQARGRDAGAVPDRATCSRWTAWPCSRTTCPRSSGRSATASSSRACASRSARASPTTRRRRSSRRPPQRDAGKAQPRRATAACATTRAGLPFAPSRIAPGAPDAGLQWFWNVQERYQAARLPRALPRDGPRRPHRTRRALHRRDVQADPLAPRRPARAGPRVTERAGQRVGGRGAVLRAVQRPRVRLAPIPQRREPRLGAALRRPARLPAPVAPRAAHERERRRGPLHAELLRRRGAEPDAPGRRAAPGTRAGSGARRPSAATAARSRPSAAATRASSSARTCTRRRWWGSTTCSRRSTSPLRSGRRRRIATSAPGASPSRATAGTSAGPS